MGQKIESKNFNGNTPEDLINQDLSLLYQVLDVSRFLDGSKYHQWVKTYFLIEINRRFDPATGETLLHQAVWAENLGLLAYLKNHGAIGKPDFSGKTPEALINHLNIIYKVFDQVKKVEESGSEFERWINEHFVDQVDALESKTGDTLLHRAIREKKIDLVVCLKNQGAKDRVENRWGVTPEDIVQRGFCYKDLYQMFDQASRLQGSMFEQWVRRSFLHQMHVNRDEKTGNTLMHTAVEMHHVDLLVYLKNLGAREGVRNFAKKTPEDLVNSMFLYKIFDQASLMQGSRFEQWVKRQFFSRIDSSVDGVGDTLLHRAVREMNIRLLVYLKNQGATDEISNFFSQTPESLVRRYLDTLYHVLNAASQLDGSASGFEKWVDAYLLTKINAVDPRNGQTLLQRAARERNSQLFNYLKQHGAIDLSTEPMQQGQRGLNKKQNK